MGTQGPVPPIIVKSVYWGIGHIERSIRPKLNIKARIPTVNNTTKYYPHRSTGLGTSHINQTGILVSWAHGICNSHQI